jgi:predicted porin
MKKSLLALAALTAFAGVASAQSSVTLYGRVDVAVGKGIGTDKKSIGNGSGSRFGVRGVEDLGGGLKALFHLEHRFNADTGATSSSTRFWHGRSLVGLSGGFGQVVLGREYAPAYLMNQGVADPWGGDTIVADYLDGVGLNNRITSGRIAKTRYDSSITYNGTWGPVSFGIQTSERTDTLYMVEKRPFNVAMVYAGGPVRVSLAYERTGEEATETAEWTTLNGTYDFGMVKAGLFFGTGDTATGGDHRSWMVTATAPIGAGELRASYGKLEDRTANVDTDKGFALGYHYSVSRRTTLYADVARNTGIRVGGDEETGYNVGMKHNF